MKCGIKSNRLLLLLLLLLLVSWPLFSDPRPPEAMTTLEILDELKANLDEREAGLNQRETDLDEREEDLNQRELSWIEINNLLMSYARENRIKMETEFKRGFILGSATGFFTGNLTGGYAGFKIGISYN